VTAPGRVVAPAGRWRAAVDYAARAAETAVAIAIVIGILIMSLVLMLTP
jgi:hypothetical protein